MNPNPYYGINTSVFVVKYFALGVKLVKEKPEENTSLDARSLFVFVEIMIAKT